MTWATMGEYGRALAEASEARHELAEAVRIMKAVGPYLDPRIPEAKEPVEAFDAFLGRHRGEQ